MIQIARAFGEAALSLRPLTDFVLSQLHSQTFALLSNRESIVKQVTGKPYAQAIATARLDCEQRVAAARMQRKSETGAALQVDQSRLQEWLSERAAFQEDELSSKLFYLRRCSYFVMDPHMDETGVRRKQRRIPPPARAYECARDWRERSEESAAAAAAAKGPARGAAFGEWECLQVSVFDIQWGVVAFHDDVLQFTVTAKPASIDEVPVIPEMEPLCPMRGVQRYALRAMEALYKRTYRCQQSALEFFYRDGGFRNSVFLYFPEEVGRKEEGD